MKLSELLQGIEYKAITGAMNIDVQGIHYDSRNIEKGFLFICIPGFKTDGHNFVDQAIENGATVILAERKIKVNKGVTLIITPNCRLAMPIVAGNFYEHPSRDLRVIGVTGTNGKTTTTHLIKAILEEWGKDTGIMGTLYARIADSEKILGNTTPESVEIEEFMNLSRKNNADYVVMEVSSHALDLGRVDQIAFDAAVFTNLTQDHLDYHHSMEEYRKAKAKLFEQVNRNNGFAIINADDEAARSFADICADNYTFAIDEKSNVRAVNVQSSLKGSQFTVLSQEGSFDINMKLIGKFSVYNALSAIAFALKEGIDIDTIKAALQKVGSVAGRFEQVDCGQDFTVVVDYAHTPDGLENILKTGRDIVENRLITVFGCGGDRDRTKRPLMGNIAARYSDFSVVTSDNPRTENPEAIIDDIIPGLDQVEDHQYRRIVDRREAISHAISMAHKGDLLIIAGKGHETYQLVNGKVLDFDDRKVAREFLEGKDQ